MMGLINIIGACAPFCDLRARPGDGAVFIARSWTIMAGEEAVETLASAVLALSPFGLLAANDVKISRLDRPQMMSFTVQRLLTSSLNQTWRAKRISRGSYPHARDVVVVPLALNVIGLASGLL